MILKLRLKRIRSRNTFDAEKQNQRRGANKTVFVEYIFCYLFYNKKTKIEKLCFFVEKIKAIKICF